MNTQTLETMINSTELINNRIKEFFKFIINFPNQDKTFGEVLNLLRHRKTDGKYIITGALTQHRKYSTSSYDFLHNYKMNLISYTIQHCIDILLKLDNINNKSIELNTDIYTLYFDKIQTKEYYNNILHYLYNEYFENKTKQNIIPSPYQVFKKYLIEGSAHLIEDYLPEYVEYTYIGKYDLPYEKYAYLYNSISKLDQYQYNNRFDINLISVYLKIRIS